MNIGTAFVHGAGSAHEGNTEGARGGGTDGAAKKFVHLYRSMLALARYHKATTGIAWQTPWLAGALPRCSTRLGSAGQGLLA